jgi:serine/threonine protein kinase
VGDDLTGLLDMAFKFSEVQVKSIARQLLQVLEFMHERNFVHRDLKVCSSFLLYYYIKYYTIYIYTYGYIVLLFPTLY